MAGVDRSNTTHSTSTPQLEAFFLNVDHPAHKQRFCLHQFPATQAVRGLVIYIHPFGEELNKSRRMSAMQAKQLACAGFAVLQIDLLGCGDSAGDFADASWSAWLDDIDAAINWLRQRHAAPELPMWLWGMRAGCLLATDAAARTLQPVNFLFWQPVISGKPQLQQFLRLRMAGDLLDGKAKGVMDEMRKTLAAGQSVHVAGYTLNTQMATGLELAKLHPPPTVPGQVIWLEISGADNPELTPVARGNLDLWRNERWSVTASIVRGPGFWQTVEIEDAPELISQTMISFEDARLPHTPHSH